ncbi:MAG: selenide, water dikinase SelD [Bdellovibrionales bacterium]|nr:selenide, water dikinase SelD [Bdellovibrionales bacterium]
MIKLTQTVKKGGCAAKVPAMILKEILSGVKFPPRIPGVMIDGDHFDDAAIFKIDDNISLVQTLDFFTPIVDSPYEFGAIAAANALSDVYAMGGRPKTCMAILAAPMATMENSVIQEVLQGACDVIAKAEASLVGGHSIDDDTLKFGLSVTGIVPTQQVWSNEGARAGDVLILTKPLGTGTICAGIKKEVYSQADAEEAMSSMKRLNNIIDFLSEDELKHIHGATDVTGFGLAGHGYQVAKASQVSLKINHHSLPLFKLTLESLKASHLTKAHRSNLEYTQNFIKFARIEELEKQIYFDPQTSGGLLLSVSPEVAPLILKKLQASFPKTSIIGSVEKLSDFYVYVE